jgi:hypothetical protein
MVVAGSACPSWRETIINNATGQVRHQHGLHSFLESGLTANSLEKPRVENQGHFPSLKKKPRSTVGVGSPLGTTFNTRA